MHAIFDIMKHINTFYYNNRNIETLISKIIITITAKTIKNIKLPREKKLKNINKRGRKKEKTKIIIIIIALIMGTKFNQIIKKAQ